MQELKNAFQHKNEWFSLLKAIGPLESFIEIGTCKGGTFESLAAVTSGLKISIDLATGRFGGIGTEAAENRNKRIKRKFRQCHFIDGDSSKIDTVKQLASILGNSQVDFLFIDGDHAYRGVLTDFMLYRQFVRQGGFIAFHDIIDSEFHRNAGCYVHELWQKIGSRGTEFISPDNTDVTKDAEKIGTNRFGGIGLLKNDFSESRHHIFQVVHDNESIKICVDTVKDYIPTLMYNTDTVFFENAIIRRVYEQYRFKKNDYVGITSPILTRKTLTTIDYLISKCGEGVDVLNYGNLHSIAGSNLDVWKHNGNGRQGTNLYLAAVELNDSRVLKFNIFKRSWTCLYCNYFVCKVAIFETYVKTILIPVMDWLPTTRWCTWNDSKLGLYHRKKWYPISVFLLECMFGTFLSTKAYTIKSLRDELPNTGILCDR
jgi:hypothetical protein